MRSPSDFDGHTKGPLSILPTRWYALVTEKIPPGEAAERIIMAVAPGSSAEDAARALLGTVDDACLVYNSAADSARLVAGAARDRTAAARLSACIGQNAPPYVVETIRRGVPRTFVCRGVSHDSSPGIALDDWPAAVVIEPRYGLVTSVEAAGVVCGAIVMLRSRAGCRPYSEFDIDVFRLVGLRVASRLRG